VETIGLIAVLAGRGPERRLVELAAIEALGPNGDYLLVSTTPGFKPEGEKA
jgi:type IV secretion system protein TrbB